MSSLALHTHGRLSLAYKVSGTGDHPVIALHGYGLDSGAYDLLVNEHRSIRLYAFDLFFHAASAEYSASIDVNNTLNEQEWQDFILDFAKSQELESFSLISYSMGSRLAMALLPRLSAYLDTFTMVAPDGFIESGWYRFAVKTSIGRVVFKRLPDYRSELHAFARAIKKLGILDEKLHRIALNSTSTKEKCSQLYNTWMFLRDIKPSIEEVSGILELQSIPTKVHLGRYDRIIPPYKILKWSYLEKKPSSAIIHDAGHLLLKQEVFSRMRFDFGH